MKAAITQSPKKVFTFFKEAREELKRVSWPSRETTIRYTIIVIVASLGVSLVTGGIDYVLALILEKIIL